MLKPTQHVQSTLDWTNADSGLPVPTLCHHAVSQNHAHVCCPTQAQGLTAVGRVACTMHDRAVNHAGQGSSVRTLTPDWSWPRSQTGWCP